MAGHGPEFLHGTAIALAGRAALIRGAPGTGKSDLALRCLMQPASAVIPEQAILVADDQVIVQAIGGCLLLRCPPTIRGRLEVRGVGIVEMPWKEPAELRLVVDLVLPEQVERLPEPSSVHLQDVGVRRLALAPFEASSPLKLLLALRDDVTSAWHGK
ncbi:HPr kinase/phosphorylase [Leptospira interrogans]